MAFTRVGSPSPVELVDFKENTDVIVCPKCKVSVAQLQNGIVKRANMICAVPQEIVCPNCQHSFSLGVN